MTNLLEETKEIIAESGHEISDIVFIGSEISGHSCTWDEFCILANKDYDSGYGGQEVAFDLIIIFKDKQRMCRGEYDGSEWWTYSSHFKRPENEIKISNLFCEIGWDSLEEINK